MPQFVTEGQVRNSHALERRLAKTFAMNSAESVSFNRFAVFERAIAFMLFESVLGVKKCELFHGTVARDFRQNGCQRNNRYL